MQKEEAQAEHAELLRRLYEALSTLPPQRRPAASMPGICWG